MRLNRRPSYFRTTDERLSERRKINWGKYTYYFVLFLVVLVVGYFLVNYFVYAEGDGQVMFERLFVQETRDIRVKKIYVKEGDSVRKGQPLFLYVENEDAAVSALAAPVPTVASNFYYSPETERDILRVIDGIKVKELDKKVHGQTLEQLKGDYEVLKKQAILDACIPGKLKSARDHIENTEMLLKKADEEIVILKVHLKNLKEINSTAAIKSRQTAEADLAEKIALRKLVAGGAVENKFLATDDGVVTKIYPNDYEVVLKGDTVMEIYKLTEVRIKAFFEQSDLSFLKNGKTVTIKFSDGTNGVGVIERYCFATQPLPPEFQKRYEPVKRNIVVDIVPPTREEAMKWKSFYKLSVKVYVKKHNRWSST